MTRLMFIRCMRFAGIFAAATVVLLSAFGCKKGLRDTAIHKVEIFEKYEEQYFQGINLHALRNRIKQEPLEYELRYQNRFGKAIFQIRPERKIFLNFPQDSIGTGLLKVLDTLQIRAMYNINDATQLEFWHGDKYVILYRDRPYSKLSDYRGTQPTALANNWKYITCDLRGD